jgi:hypothetical protein
MKRMIVLSCLLLGCETELRTGLPNGPAVAGTGGDGGSGAFVSGSGGSGGVGGVVGTGGSPSLPDVGVDSPATIPDAGVEVSEGGGTDTVDAAADVPVTARPPAARVLDDLEGGRMDFTSALGIAGSWRAVDDLGDPPQPPAAGGPSVIETISPPRGDSTRGAHLHQPGTHLALTLHDTTTPADLVDLSAYEGLAFWARSDGPDRTLFVALADPGVDPTHRFWSDAAAGSPWPARRLTLSDRWERQVLLFEDVTTAFLDSHSRPVDIAAVSGIHFVPPQGATVDFWVDDLVLLCRGPCP